MPSWVLHKAIGSAAFAAQVKRQMVRTGAGWRVARYTLTVTFSDGARRLMGLAYREVTGRV